MKSGHKENEACKVRALTAEYIICLIQSYQLENLHGYIFVEVTNVMVYVDTMQVFIFLIKLVIKQ